VWELAFFTASLGFTLPKSTFPTIETERLLLREITFADVPALFEVHGDHECMKWFGVDPLVDEAGAQKLVEAFASWRALPNQGTRWGIQVKGQPFLAGTCGLFAWNRGWHKCTIGYELNPTMQGNGYMQEALRSCLAWGFESMQLNRIEAQVHPSNASSIRSVERLGFKREGLLRQVGFWGGQFHDLYQYALLRQEWCTSEA
jgi:ribosomal-protein-alanine N-acetyltransferase